MFDDFNGVKLLKVFLTATICSCVLMRYCNVEWGLYKMYCTLNNVIPLNSIYKTMAVDVIMTKTIAIPVVVAVCSCVVIFSKPGCDLVQLLLASLFIVISMVTFLSNTASKLAIRMGISEISLFSNLSSSGYIQEANVKFAEFADSVFTVELSAYFLLAIAISYIVSVVFKSVYILSVQFNGYRDC